MSYAEQIWQNGSLGGTPISAARLSHVESGLKDLSTQVEGILEAHNIDGGSP